MRRFLLAVIIIVNGLGVVAKVAGHPLALSRWQARTDGRDVHFDFSLDASAVLDLIARSPSDRPASGIGEIAAHGDKVLAHVREAFTVSNTDLPCAGTFPPTVTVDEPGGKVRFGVRYRCPTELGLLTIESRLFGAEAHDTIGDFIHVRAFERYFFSRTMAKVRIDVPQLRQVLPADVNRHAGWQGAEPPPGVFDERAKHAVRGRPITAGAGEATRLDGWGAFRSGVLHVLSGLDHVLFLVLLVIGSRSVLQLVVAVVGFSVAHGAVLALAAAGLLSLSPRLAEPLIALSIVWMAGSNVLRPEGAAKAGAALGFGVVHGLGFAGALGALGLSAGSTDGLLAGFNAGAFVAQWLVALPLALASAWLRVRSGGPQRLSLGVNLVAGLVGLVWFVLRL